MNSVQIDRKKVRTAIQAGIPLIITTYTLPHEMEEYIGSVLSTFLEECGQSQMEDTLVYCLKELTNNAKKANTKRVYFEEKNLDITNKIQYDQGMKTFKNDTLGNINHFLSKQKEKGLYIKVLFQTKNNKIKIEIRNHAELTVFEYKRIHDKLSRAQMYDSVEEGIAQLLDETEGAGLGLVIMVLILRRIGLTEENFQVLSEGGDTITRLILPFSEKIKADISSLSKDFVALIDGLPEFPENIAQINTLINDPDSKMSEIASKISNDVALTAELLKMVNSAAFALTVPCESIGEAVKFAGLRGIRNLLFSIGTMQTLVAKGTKDQKLMWNHSYKVAFYAYNLARNFCKGSVDRMCVEDSYVCGLLHDMGKIIFENAHPAILGKIEEMCESRGITADLFERMVAGMNHGELGALIAEKWNFPPVIVDVIRYHHAPDEAPVEMKKLSSLIYTADMMVHYGENSLTFDQIDNDVLKIFGLESEERFLAVSDKLNKSFVAE